MVLMNKRNKIDKLLYNILFDIFNVTTFSLILF